MNKKKKKKKKKTTDKRTESRFCKSYPCDRLQVHLSLHMKIDYQYWLVSPSVDSVNNAENMGFR